MLVRKEVLNEVGLFDPIYFMYYEEIDLCWRIKLRGYRILFVPKSIVYHEGGRLIFHEEWALGYFHVRKNHIATLIKNYEMRNLIKFLPLYLIIVSFHVCYMILKGKNEVALACSRSVLWNVKNLKFTLLKRAYVQKRVRRVPDKEVMKYMEKFRVPKYLIRLPTEAILVDTLDRSIPIRNKQGK